MSWKFLLFSVNVAYSQSGLSNRTNSSLKHNVYLRLSRVSHDLRHGSKVSDPHLALRDALSSCRPFSHQMIFQWDKKRIHYCYICVYSCKLFVINPQMSVLRGCQRCVAVSMIHVFSHISPCISGSYSFKKELYLFKLTSQGYMKCDLYYSICYLWRRKRNAL